MNIAHWLMRSAARWPDRPALFSGAEMRADYAGFVAQAQRLAAGLVAAGVAPGDRVAIFMKNVPDYLVVMYGAWIAGAAVVPINAKLHGAEAAWIIANARAALVFATPGLDTDLAQADCAARIVTVGGPDYAALMPDVAHPVCDRSGDDLAWLFYTSGTTGRPKGVRITHRMIRTMALDYYACVDTVSPDDTALYAAPMSHGAGLYNVMHVQMGARHVCPASGGFDEAEIFALARHHTRVHMFAAPTMVKRLVLAAQANGETGQGLRTIVYGGGPMYLADIEQASATFGPIFVQIYGQGECPMAITALSRDEVADRTHPNWRARLASVGRAQASVELRIGDADGHPLPVGQVGEIMVRGDTVMPGYWQNDAASALALAGGWLRTGDMGALDADGYLTLHDRSKDMIISGGSNIYPREVEEVLLTHPDVLEVSVVGQPDPDWGEVVVAFVVATPGGQVTAQTLDTHCLTQIARFKRPKDYRFVPTLPKNNYGKVLKTELRALLAQDMNA